MRNCRIQVGVAGAVLSYLRFFFFFCFKLCTSCWVVHVCFILVNVHQSHAFDPPLRFFIDLFIPPSFLCVEASSTASLSFVGTIITTIPEPGRSVLEYLLDICVKVRTLSAVNLRMYDLRLTRRSCVSYSHITTLSIVTTSSY